MQVSLHGAQCGNTSCPVRTSPDQTRPVAAGGEGCSRCSWAGVGTLAGSPDVVEVEVGTETQQHDRSQLVVDQVAEFGLQVALAVPEDLRGKHQM